MEMTERKKERKNFLHFSELTCTVQHFTRWSIVKRLFLIYGQLWIIQYRKIGKWSLFSSPNVRLAWVSLGESRSRSPDRALVVKVPSRLEEQWITSSILLLFEKNKVPKVTLVSGHSKMTRAHAWGSSANRSSVKQNKMKKEKRKVSQMKSNLYSWFENRANQEFIYRNFLMYARCTTIEHMRIATQP